MSGPRHLSHLWGGFAERAVFGDVAYDAGEVEAVAEESRILGSVLLSGRSQRRIAPSEPLETRIGCTGCHDRAVFG
jgi:hypothetical protein